jgi:hypothetical protein
MSSFKKKLPVIIAITGYKCSGKDTLSKYISEKYKYKEVKISSNLKDMIKLSFDMNDIDLEYKKDTIHEKWGVTPRVLMDFLGTHVFQYEIDKIMPNMDRKFWIHKTLNAFNSQNLTPIVISDLRFEHELIELRKYSSCIVKIYRKDTSKDGFVSESEIDKLNADIIINNNTTVEDMLKEFDIKFRKMI